MITFRVQHVHAGSPCVPIEGLLDSAYSECLESGVMDRRKWIELNLDILSSEDRIEIGAFEDGYLVGGMTLAEEMDAHVGACVSVRYNYVLPEYRTLKLGTIMMRHAIQLAKTLGPQYIAFTHRKGVGLYTIRYRRLHEA